MNKGEQENEINEKKVFELEERLNEKEREYLSKRLTFEVYEDQLKKLLDNVEQVHDEFDQTLSIEKFQLEVKQLSKELPKLKTQIDSIQNRLNYFQEKKRELIEMRNEFKQMEKNVQHALEEKLLKENEFIRVTNARQILQRIEKCRGSNDLALKIFYELPMDPKHSGTNGDGEKDSS